MPSEKCFTAGECAARKDRCTPCLIARKVTPGPSPAPADPGASDPVPVPALPSLDPWDYPVHCGPGALSGPARLLPALDFSRYWNAFLEIEPPAPPFPAPEITSRDNHPVPDKSAPMRVALAAADAGWGWTLTYARGHSAHATTGRPLKGARGSIAVRLSRGEDWACAVYREGSGDWKWDTLYVNGRRKADITAFEEALK